jgi:membrane protease subunit HflC
MKNRLGVVIGVLVVAVLLSYMFMFQVRYDQVAVLTTFDRATAASIKTAPALYARLPWPIQKVQLYSTRLQLVENRLEQIQTADNKSVVVVAYLIWRIQDPLEFFTTLQDPESAKDKLLPLLSAEINGSIGRYRMDQLVNLDPDQVLLEEVEAATLAGIRERLAELRYGIAAEALGVERVMLPQESTVKVFETMRKTRERLAAYARSSGSAQAATIRSEAQSARRRILAFAQRRAEAIRAEGDKEAAQYYDTFREDQPLAIFLRRIETLKKILPHNTTFVLDAQQISVDNLINDSGAAPSSAAGGAGRSRGGGR